MKLLARERLKLAILYVLQVILVVTPVLTLVILKRKDYFASTEKIFSLSFTGIVAFGVLILQVIGKTPKKIHSLIKLSLLTLFLWALKPILSELCLIVTSVFAGELMGFLCLSYPIKMQKLKVSTLEHKKTESELKPMIENEIEVRGRL